MHNFIIKRSYEVCSQNQAQMTKSNDTNLRIAWNVIVNNHIHRRDIKTSTGHICAYKNVTFSGLELVQSSQSLGLSEIAIGKSVNDDSSYSCPQKR